MASKKISHINQIKQQILSKTNFYYQNGSFVHVHLRGGNLMGAELSYNTSRNKILHR